MNLIIDMPINGDDHTISVTVDLPRRESWSRPREPMCVMVDTIVPDIGRPLTQEEYEYCYDLVKNVVMRRKTCC